MRIRKMTIIRQSILVWMTVFGLFLCLQEISCTLDISAAYADVLPSQVQPTPTMTPTPVSKAGECVEAGDYYSAAIEGINQIQMGPVDIAQSYLPDGSPAAMNVIDSNGDGRLDIQIPWSEADAQKKAVIHFLSSICNGAPQYIEVTLSHGTPIQLEAVNGANGVTAVSDPGSDAQTIQTLILSSSKGISDILIEGAEICIYRICWSCEMPSDQPVNPMQTLPPESSPTTAQPTFTPTATPTEKANPSPTPQDEAESYYDELIVAQGEGGQSIVQIRNFNPQKKSLTSVLQSFQGLAGALLKSAGGGAGRATYISSGDLNNDGSPEVVLSFGPIVEDATYPNMVVVKNADTRAVMGNAFQAFPQGTNSDVNYNGGDIRTAVGDFIGSGTRQIAVAAGFGGNGMVRLFQYTGKPAPEGWAVVGQFYGLPPALTAQGATDPVHIGLTLAAGNLDDDPQDELVVGQGNGPLSQTIFHVLDINKKGQIEARHPYAGFKPKFRGAGGIELAVGDLDGDGVNEIIAASQGNRRNYGDERDAAPLNTIGIIRPVLSAPAGGGIGNTAMAVAERTLSGFERPSGANAIAVFDEERNPSGAMSLAIGEFDGNTKNGAELAIGTGSLRDATDRSVDADKVPPEARYRFMKVEFEGTAIKGAVNSIGSAAGFPAFPKDIEPNSRAIYLGAAVRKPTFTPLFPTPTPTPAPPYTVTMDHFTLSVASYSSFKWNAAYTEISEASGIAWTAFDATPTFTLPDFDGIADLTVTRFTVVKTVSIPTKEISLDQALLFDPTAKLGGMLSIFLPSDYSITKPITASDVSSYTKIDPGLLGGLVRTVTGEIKLSFQNLTIAVDSGGDTGTVTAGLAEYPTHSPIPDRIELDSAGFTTYLSSLSISPSSATAAAELVFPDSIASASNCKPARIDLGEIAITHTGQYYKEFLTDSFGPWTVDNTGMEISGDGFIADFSKTQSYASWTGSAAMSNSWRGVILLSGETLPDETDPLVSNTGYLKADYTFSNGLATEKGLAADFTLAQSFTFQALQPLGYQIDLFSGRLLMADSHIQGGSFANGYIYLPTKAVVDSSTKTISMFYPTMQVQSNMDLYAENLVYSQDFVWGELSRTEPVYTAYSAQSPQFSYFYLSAVYKPPYWPIDISGAFLSPFFDYNVYNSLQSMNMQGVTLRDFKKFIVDTPDTPTPSPITFENGVESWMNVAGQGIHGEFNIEKATMTVTLGPLYQPYYKGKDYTGALVPFETTFMSNPSQNDVFIASFQFADSAVFDSDVDGTVNLEGPTGADMPFADMQFTSTAHIPGARVDLSTPITLEYWGIDLTQDPDLSNAGVMCVKCGEIFLTGAGLSEDRHFGQPFYLTWGVVYSSGEWDMDGLTFSYDSSDQTFDGFPYAPQAIGLSPYNPDLKVGLMSSYLQTAGALSFDFFGENYVNVLDYYNTDYSVSPYDARLILTATDTVTVLGTAPSNDHVSRGWGDGFGQFEYDIKYDDGDQDGFVGTGTMEYRTLFGGELDSTLVLSSDRICMSIYTPDEYEYADLTVGPIAHFGQMIRTTGCACITDGQLERVTISGELEVSADANVAIRSAGYATVDYNATPETTELVLTGDIYYSLVTGMNMEMNGSARFTIDREQEFVEGRIDANYDTSALFTGLEASGSLDWHLGYGESGDAYQSLQGMTSVQVVAPVGGQTQEGGFYIGQNAPKANAWALNDAGSRFGLNTTALPEYITGVYGYVFRGDSIDLPILGSGGVETYAGLGVFTSVGTQSMYDSGLSGLGCLVGNVGIHIWGEILEGAVSADATGNLQLITTLPPAFEGSFDLEGCAAWVLCGSVGITCGLNSTDGFYVE